MRLAMALLATAGLALPATAPAQESAEVSPGGFRDAISHHRFVLSRAVTHVLPDGREIVVKRTYRVTVEPLDRGWVIEGRSIDVAIDAPPQLAALAEIERQRDDSATFPIFLQADGMLAPVEGGRPTDGEAASEAGALVASRIAESNADEERKRAATAMARSLVAAGQRQRIAWPADLFRPIAAERIESREVSGGTVTVALTAETDPRSGLMRRFERRVTTRIGTSERVVRERWEMQAEPAGDPSTE